MTDRAYSRLYSSLGSIGSKGAYTWYGRVIRISQLYEFTTNGNNDVFVMLSDLAWHLETWPAIIHDANE